MTMTTWTDDKEQELFEAQETIADLLMLYSAEQNECAGLHATNAELLEALRLCECELTLYVGAGWSTAPWAPRGEDAITAAREAIRKASR